MEQALATAQPATSPYAAALSDAPLLLQTLEQAAHRELQLRDETALARTLLDQLLRQFAAASVAAKSETLTPTQIGATLATLQQVASLVGQAATLERNGSTQALSAAHLVILLGGLRDELARTLAAKFGDVARVIVDDVFARARWTGDLSTDVVRDALTAPASYEVRFRTLERDEKSGTVGLTAQERALLDETTGNASSDAEESP